jgi:hypothetical protein
MSLTPHAAVRIEHPAVAGSVSAQGYSYEPTRAEELCAQCGYSGAIRTLTGTKYRSVCSNPQRRGGRWVEGDYGGPGGVSQVGQQRGVSRGNKLTQTGHLLRGFAALASSTSAPAFWLIVVGTLTQATAVWL